MQRWQLKFWRLKENSWSNFDRNVYLFPSTFSFYIDKDVLTDVPLVNNIQEYYHVHKYTWSAKCYLSKNNLCKGASLYYRYSYQGTELSIMVLDSSLILKSIYSLYRDICWWKKTLFFYWNIQYDQALWTFQFFWKIWDSPAHQDISKTIKLEDGEK